MAPTTLTPLFCLPTDVYDFVGTSGTQLRLDDNLQATGQTVFVVADADLGATTVSITPLIFPMLRGDTLAFDGGGMDAVVTVTLAATARVGATSLSVAALDGALNAQCSARDAGVNVALAARLLKACRYATAEVLRWCSQRYASDDLAQSWSVNNWASTLAADWLCKRLLRAVPQSVADDAERVREELKDVRFGRLNVENTPTRSAGWPFMDNVTVDVAYYDHKVRVQPTISDNVPSQNIQYVDWNDVLFGALEQ